MPSLLLIEDNKIVQIDAITIASALLFLGTLILVTDNWEAYYRMPTQEGGVFLMTSFIAPFGLSAILGLGRRITPAIVFWGLGLSWMVIIFIFLLIFIFH